MKKIYINNRDQWSTTKINEVDWIEFEITEAQFADIVARKSEVVVGVRGDKKEKTLRFNTPFKQTKAEKERRKLILEWWRDTEEHLFFLAETLEQRLQLLFLQNELKNHRIDVPNYWTLEKYRELFELIQTAQDRDDIYFFPDKKGDDLPVLPIDPPVE